MQEEMKKFLNEHGLEGFSDPMDELPQEVMLYRWENE